MVKIRFKPILLSFIVLLLLMNVAYASRQALQISDVDVKVGGKTAKNLKDKDTISKEADPGDSVEFRVELKNNYTSSEDLKIEDISVTVTIDGIDDGDDLEEDSPDFDLRAGRDKKVTLKFKVPLEVDESTFNVKIEAEGDDENGTNQKAEMDLKLEVDKENHLLKITRASLSPAEVSCNRKNVQLGTTVINIGNEDEEDISLQTANSDLGIDLKENIGTLDAEPNEPESRFSKTYSFSIPNDAAAGSYPIALRVLYDNDRKRAEETPTLTVSDCATAKKETAPKAETTSKEESEEVTVITPTTGKTTATVVQPTTTAPSGTVVTQESFLKSNAFVVGIIVAEVIAVIVGIVLVVSLFRRRG